ncbi:MAG: response regulator, partial [Microcoleaceae cyanobacterium]
MADKPKVMVVDDESNNLDLIYRTLRRQFNVFRCETVTDAMNILDAEGEMAVVISDQSMPEITGVDFLIKIKQLFPRTIRILLTGYTEEQLDSQGQGIAQADIF